MRKSDAAACWKFVRGGRVCYLACLRYTLVVFWRPTERTKVVLEVQEEDPKEFTPRTDHRLPLHDLDISRQIYSRSWMI